MPWCSVHPSAVLGRHGSRRGARALLAATRSRTSSWRRGSRRRRSPRRRRRVLGLVRRRDAPQRLLVGGEPRARASATRRGGRGASPTAPGGRAGAARRSSGPPARSCRCGPARAVLGAGPGRPPQPAADGDRRPAAVPPDPLVRPIRPRGARRADTRLRGHVHRGGRVSPVAADGGAPVPRAGRRAGPRRPVAARIEDGRRCEVVQGRDRCRSSRRPARCRASG